MQILSVILYILLAIIILLLMVVIHEFGHYIAGKILKFKINEFSVGFGPALISKTKKNGEKFSLRLIPLGGYCAFEGDEDFKINEQVDGQKSFNDEKPWKRIIVFLAGAFFNVVSAIIFSFIFILIIGYSIPTVTDTYKNPDTNVQYNQQILTSDVIYAVNGKKISVMNSFEDLVKKTKINQEVNVTVLRKGEKLDIKIIYQPIKYTDENGKLVEYKGFGIATERNFVKVNFLTALRYSFPFTMKMAWTILGTFGQLITGQIPLTSLSGPVGTIGAIADLAHQNWRNILILLPLIASNLAVFNLLPIPALDGSKVVFTTIEWIRGKPINRKVENIVHFVGFFVIFSLVILIDIIGLFT